MGKSKENKLKKTTKKSISRLFIVYLLSSVVLTMVIIGIGTYFMLEADYRFTYGNVFIFLPILFVLNGCLVYVVFQKFFLYFGIFERNIEKITSGNYKARMSNKNAGIFTSMIDNFNKMAGELENRKNLNDDFVNNFSHEFKTPISSIKGFADLLLEDEVLKEEKDKYLKIISEESHRLAQLSEKALFLSKINIQTSIPDKIQYSLDEQIKKNIILLEKYIEIKKLKINMNLDQIIYNSNPDIINHIWLNLISNAIKYSNDNGTINIKLKIIGKNIVFTIQDDGIGIDLKKQKYIFNEYYQADESHKTMGVGLGLSIVKKVVNLSNGTIQVFSKEDVGTTFIVKLKK